MNKKKNVRLMVQSAVGICGLALGAYLFFGGQGAHALTSLDIKGSTSVEPYIKALKEENGDKYKIKLSAQGSGTGISALFDKTTDIAMSSRDLKPEEQTKADKAGVEKSVIAMDGISVIVNPKLNVSNLTSSQLHDIFTGKITNWSQVNPKLDVKVDVVSRDEASGTREGFDKLLNVTNIPTGSKQIEATGEVIRTVSDNIGSIGYVSSGASLEGLKAVNVDFVAPSEANIKDHKYKLFRKFYLLNYKDSKNAEDFVKFAQTDKAQKLLKSVHYKTNFISIK